MKWNEWLGVGAGLLLTLPLAALQWSLPNEAWTRHNPPGAWKFYAAGRDGGFDPVRDTRIADYRELTQLDYNPAENRLMFSVADGDVWSVPSVRLHRFSLPDQQQLSMLTAPKADAVVAYECGEAGVLSFTATLSDEAAADAGGRPENAVFRVSRAKRGAASDQEELARFSWFGEREKQVAGTVTVEAGDRIFFRKTTLLPDDFGRRSCRVKLEVALTEVPAVLGWRAAVAPSGRIMTGEYSLLPGKIDGEAARFQAAEGSLPFALVRPAGDGAFEVTARAEKNDFCRFGAGNLILFWDAPADGSYQLDCEIANLGMDVKGGDGGFLTVTYLPDGTEIDCTRVFGLRIPASREGEPERVRGSQAFQLRAGDTLAFRFDAGFDGFADLFQAKLRLAPTTATGMVPPRPEPEQLLAQPDAPRRQAGVKFRPGLFWLGADGGWLTSEFAPESIELIRKFIPELAVIGVNSRPDLSPDPAYFRENGIPSLVQNFGSGYEPYWRAKGAFEWDLFGVAHAEPSRVALAGGAHAVAMPHPAVREAFDRLARTSVRQGYSGYGFNDMVWFWGAGRGASGYHPETVKAFVTDLLGQDEGFEIAWGKEAPRRFRFADYAKFYTGVVPQPEQFGLKSWAEYRPRSAAEQRAMRQAGQDLTGDWLLFDLLTHYEWLKVADRVGRAVKEEGGVFQVLPNPEDLANGCDWLFLAGLRHVYGRTEEYFDTPLYLNALFCRFPYFRDRSAAGSETGIVLEGGAGGNEKPYYTSEMSLQLAYEVSLAAESDHLEADFWPSFRAPLAEVVDNELARLRYEAILAYGLGFKYAREDGGVKRLNPDFVSITSRRIFRPWGHEWHVWNWRLNTEFSPDQLLARQGFVFAGQGEESVAEPEFGAETVLFNASPATVVHWRNFLSKLRSGKIGNGVVMAGALQELIGPALKPVPFQTVEPGWNWEARGKLSGALTDDSGNVFAPMVRVTESYSAPAGFTPVLSVGGAPVVVSRRIGKGTLYVILTTPVPVQAGKEPADPEAAEAIWQALLAGLAVKPHWQSHDPLEVRIYTGDGMILASAQRYDVLAERVDGVYPATAPNESAFSLRLEPGKRYAYRTFPALSGAEVVADADGLLTLPLGRAAQELFFVVPAEQGKALQQKLETRAAEFRQAMTLDGLTGKK